MTNPITPIATTPVSTPVGAENKSETDLAKVVEENNKTTKTCAYAALGASCATLIPLSILAYKTGKLSKVASNIENGVKPILDNAQEVSQKAKDELIKQIEKISSVFDEKELKGILESIKGKIDGVDIDKYIETITSSAKKFTDTMGTKLEKLNIDAINTAVENFSKKLGELDTSKLSEDTAEAVTKFVNTLQSKLEGIDISKLSAETKKIVQAIIEKLKVMNPKNAESVVENVEQVAENIAK